MTDREVAIVATFMVHASFFLRKDVRVEVFFPLITLELLFFFNHKTIYHVLEEMAASQSTSSEWLNLFRHTICLWGLVLLTALWDFDRQVSSFKILLDLKPSSLFRQPVYI